jgi:hypothetical protein
MSAEEPTPLAAGASGKITRRAILKKKLQPALVRWAIVSMEDRVGDYIDAAGFNFVTLVIAEINREPNTDIVRLFRETPLVIPRSAKRVSAFARDFDVAAFAEAYQKTLQEVRAARAKLQRGASLKVRELTYQGIFPGASRPDLTRYCSMPPTEVALDYVCWKFKVGRSGEALKKQLRRNLSPKRIRQLRDTVRTEADAVEALEAYFPAPPSAPSVAAASSSEVPPSSSAT